MKDNRDKDLNQEALKAAAGSKIDAIKEIIFGQNIREYDEEFVKIREEIAESDKAANSRIADLENQLSKAIAELDKTHTKQMELNHKQLLKEVEKLGEQQTDRKELGKLLIQMGNKLSS